MRTHSLPCVLAIPLGLLAGATPAPGATLQADIVVSGGSFSACGAALAAARTNPNAEVLLIEPTDWLGGQATVQGVSAIDNPYHNPGGALMRENPPLYYPADYLDFLDRMKEPPAEAPGTGMAPNGTSWVSREAFDPRTGAYILDQMMAEYTNLTVLKLTVVKNATTEDASDEFGTARRITGLTLVQRTPKAGRAPFDGMMSAEVLDWWQTADSAQYTKEVHTVAPRDSQKGIVVIEASETGDVLVLSGADYTVGRELTTEYFDEAGNPPDMDEDGTQAYVFPFCMGIASTEDAEESLKTPFPDFDTYYATQSSSYYSMGSHTWERIWTYRRLYSPGSPWQFDSVIPGDVSMQNWYPGNDYPYGTIFLPPAAAAAQAATDWLGGIDASEFAAAEKHAIGWYFYMKERYALSGDTRFLKGDDPDNMMGTSSGLAKWPYMRGIRRATGLENFRINERTLFSTTASTYTGGTSHRFYDSVGIGNYPMDIHPSLISTGISPSFSLPAPFYIPFRAIGVSNVRNLLASGKAMAQSYVTNSTYRLHPIEWASGSAAGTAAALMYRDGLTNMEMLDREPLRELQLAVDANSPISWAAFDEDPLPPNYGEAIINSFNPIVAGTPFPIEIYFPRATRARIYADSIFIGETTTRANGRLLFNATLNFAPSSYLIDVYNDSGAHIGTVTVGDIGTETSLIIDNEDARFSTTGDWTVASSQPNKWGPSYSYKFADTGAGTATFSSIAPVAGRYKLYAWWPESTNRATDTPFTIHHSTGTTTLRLNQQANGGMWNLLGEFKFAGNANDKVVLSTDVTDTSKLVVADAIQLEPIDLETISGNSWVVR
ncbi:MAG: hypothetical protein PWP23_2190 [Candidatus Sumerlaeota bacterium]|nr:hypothetical protein [Candidatus Sumerlaeota bacterium]